MSANKAAAVQPAEPVEPDDEDDEMAPVGESREERFVRIGERRMTATLKQLDLLGNLSSANYAFGEEEVESMFGALEQSVARLRDRFENVLRREAKQRPTFKF